MDSKINKKRLSDFLAYEWILMIFLCVVAIVVWELVYTVSAVRLSVGQDYKFFYDRNMVYGDNYNALMNTLDIQDDLGYENGKTFSFEIQKLHAEEVLSDNDVLSLRLSVQEGDMLFTDDKAREIEDGEIKYTESLARTRVDSTDIPIVTYEKLLEQAKEYLLPLHKNGATAIDKANLDPNKVLAEFEDRLGDDNRFRSKTEKEMGLILEQERLEKLCDEVNAFDKLMMKLDNEYFMTYTRYEQSKAIAEAQNADQESIDQLNQLIEKEITYQRQNARYGLRVDKLALQTNKDKIDTSVFFSLKGETENVSKDAVIMVFDFHDDQPALQFESITVINNIVRACSTILD